MKYSFTNQTIVITGAASGIGKIMLRKCLERKAKQVFILDYNEQGIKDVINEFAYFQVPLHAVVVDLSAPTQIQSAINQVFSITTNVDILINNAGIVVGSDFVNNKTVDIDRTMMINSNAPMYLALAFLPKMIEHNRGVICNIASLAALTSTPKLSVYSASKWAILGWSEGLRVEMKQAKNNILINAVTPFYINTGMFDGVKSKLLPILDPEKTADKIIRNIEKGKKRTSLPLPGWIIRLAQGILPLSMYDFVMGDIFGIYDTMADFKGRK